jgi:hypothetical protein
MLISAATPAGSGATGAACALPGKAAKIKPVTAIAKIVRNIVFSRLCGSWFRRPRSPIIFHTDFKYLARTPRYWHWLPILIELVDHLARRRPNRRTSFGFRFWFGDQLQNLPTFFFGDQLEELAPNRFV